MNPDFFDPAQRSAFPSATTPDRTAAFGNTNELLLAADALAERLFNAKRFREAASVAEAAIELSHRSHPTLINAARCAIYGGKPDYAEALLREARRSDSRPLGNRTDLELMVLALGWQGKHDEAERVLQQLPESDQCAYNLGWHTMRHGQFKQAFPLLERGRPIGVWGDKDFSLPTPRWDGVSDLSGKKVLLNLERGLGDHIIQVRHARDLSARGVLVIVKTHPSLVMALSQAEGVAQAGAGVADHDVWLPGMSAPHLLGLDRPSGTPYMKPLPWMVDKWREILGEKKAGGPPRIAVRWQGNPMFEYEQMRVLPARDLIDALRPYGELFSVQRDQGAELCPDDIRDLAPQLESWEDTFAALSLMDAVVTSCTSIAHAAASMGIPTVVLTPVLAYYPWTDETVLPKSSWYDSALVARQERPGDWSSAIAEAVAHVETFLSN